MTENHFLGRGIVCLALGVLCVLSASNTGVRWLEPVGVIVTLVGFIYIVRSVRDKTGEK